MSKSCRPYEGGRGVIYHGQFSPTVQTKEMGLVCQKNFFTDTAPRAMEAKEKINKWNYIKIKSFFTAKETINKNKEYSESSCICLFLSTPTAKALVQAFLSYLVHFNNQTSLLGFFTSELF